MQKIEDEIMLNNQQLFLLHQSHQDKDFSKQSVLPILPL